MSFNKSKAAAQYMVPLRQIPFVSNVYSGPSLMILHAWLPRVKISCMGPRTFPTMPLVFCRSWWTGRTLERCSGGKKRSLPLRSVWVEESRVLQCWGCRQSRERIVSERKEQAARRYKSNRLRTENYSSEGIRRVGALLHRLWRRDDASR